MDKDTRLMREAIRAAEMSAVYGDYPIGAVLEKDGEVHYGFNRVQTTPSPLAHAECDAIRTLTGELRVKYLDGWTLYTTAQPCMMCLGACYWAGIRRIVFGLSQFDLSDFGQVYGNNRFKFRACPLSIDRHGAIAVSMIPGVVMTQNFAGRSLVLKMMLQHVKMETKRALAVKGHDKVRGGILQKNRRARDTRRGDNRMDRGRKVKGG